MFNHTLGRWLLASIAVVGLALVAPAVGAHSIPTAADAPPYDGGADEWADRMEGHMTEYSGPGSVEWMESHMGLTVEEMAQGRTDDGYGHGNGRYGQGHGC